MSSVSVSLNSKTNFVKSQKFSPPLDMKRVATIILSGGQGVRLFPLTMARCKPAMCYGGRYRLIDIPISNSINSGCNKIYILTQFLSTSLHRHITSTYKMASFSSGFIDILGTEEKPHMKSWFQGTADAVRQNLEYFIETPADYFLILSGDQLYHMDFRKMLQFAYESDADVVVSALPIVEEEASRMGILKIHENQQISAFVEKPQLRSELQAMKLNEKEKDRLNISELKENNYLASMGIYLFKRNVLIELLKKDLRDDFGKHLIPSLVEQGRAAAYIHQGYWEDIGTIHSFYQANMALTSRAPPFNCYNEDWKIYANHSALPSARIFNTQVNHSIIAEGCIVEADEISNSVLGPRTMIHRGSIIRDSYLMGNDHYAPVVEIPMMPQKFQIGKNCLIRKAIIDKHVYIGEGVQLINKENQTHYDSENVYVREGIIVIPKGATIPDGFIF